MMEVEVVALVQSLPEEGNRRRNIRLDLPPLRVRCGAGGSHGHRGHVSSCYFVTRSFLDFHAKNRAFLTIL